METHILDKEMALYLLLCSLSLHSILSVFQSKLHFFLFQVITHIYTVLVLAH